MRRDVATTLGGVALLLVTIGSWPAGTTAAQVGTEPTKPAVVDGARRPTVFEERSRVELALVETVVLDRRGRHIRGLDASAFSLFEGKREIPIVSFDEIDLDRDRLASRDLPEALTTPDPAPADAPPQVDSSAAAVNAAAEGSPQPAGLSGAMRRAVESRLDGPRWFVLTFDGYNNVSALRMSQVRKAAKKWLDESIRPGDRVAVFEMTPYVASVIGFTDDIESVRRAIDRVRVFPAGSMGEDLIAQRLEQGGLLRRDVLEAQLRNAGTFGAELLSAERDQFYVGMSEVADVLAAFEGTRAIVLFSGGFPVTLTRATGSTGGFTTRFKAMLRSLERLGIRVFTFDIGEEGSFTDASESTNFRLALDNLGFGAEWLDDLQVGAKIDTHHAHQEILSVLGNETGGRFWRTRAYGDGLQAVADDLTHYYLIGYTPPADATSSDDYVPIKVVVAGRGVQVVTRRGRFRNEPLRPVAAERARPAATPTAPAAAADAMSLPLKLAVRPLFYAGESGRTLVVLPIHIDGPLDGVPISDREIALDFDVVVEALAAGEAIESGHRSVRVTYEPRYAGRFATGLHVREAILVPPAALELKISARLNGTGRSGTWSETVIVPERTSVGFGLGELALLTPVDRAPQVFDVFAGDEPVHGTHPSRGLPDPLGDSERAQRPPVAVEARHPRAVPLLAQVRVNAPPPKTAEHEQPLRMDWELLPVDGGDALAPPVRYRRLALATGGGTLDVVVDLDLAAVQPGDYVLRLTAVDIAGSRRASRTQPLIITP